MSVPRLLHERVSSAQLDTLREFADGQSRESRHDAAAVFADLGAQCVGIIGTGIYPTSSPEQIEQNVKAAQWKLTTDEMKEIDGITLG